MATQATPEQVERWIFQSNDPSDTSAQWKAAQWLREWNASSTAVTGTLKNVLEQSSHEHVQFYALSTLGRLPLLEERDALRQFLLYQYSPSATFLRNKVAWILARFVWQDVPLRWTTLEEDLLQHYSIHQPAIFLKTLHTILEEFVVIAKDEAQVDPLTASSSSFVTREAMRRVKDFLKGYITVTGVATGRHENPNPPSSCLLGRLFDRVVQLLEESLVSHAESSNVVLALQALQGFFLWTDVTVLTQQQQQQSTLDTATNQPKAFSILMHLISNPDYSADIHVSTLQVWQEWSSSTNASMENSATYKFPTFTSILEQIHKSDLLPYQGESKAEIEVVIEVSKLISSIGLEALPVIWKQGDIAASAVLNNQILDLFFRAFAYDDIDVTIAVLPLAARLATAMEDQDQISQQHATVLRSHLPRILHIIYQQFQYPEDFSYDFEDEIDAEEFSFRTELSKLYSKLVRVAPDVCLQFVCDAASQQTASLSQAPTPVVEAFLRLLFHYCEGIRPLPGLKTLLMKNKNDIFVALLSALHQSDITNHPHREVLCLYYETAVRYYPIFNPKYNVSGDVLLSRVLEALSGGRGLQHPHFRVRSRCCYLLLRLVKSTVSLMRPFVETAVSGIHGLLSSSAKESLREDDTFYLFETMGLLLGKTGLPPSDQQRYLTQLMTPHVQSIEARLQTRTTSSGDNDPARLEEDLAQSIAALAHLSKGFSSKNPDEVKAVLAETLRISQSVLGAFPSSEVIRNKTMVLVQRMIVCLGETVLPQAQGFLFTLIEHCTDEDILFVTQLINQLCMKFKSKVVPVLDSALLPYLSKCQSLVPATQEFVHHTDPHTAGGDASGLPPHLRTEQLGIQKLIFVVLQHMATYDATAIFISPTNVGSLETILQTMNDGAIYVHEPQVKKTCIKFFGDLLNAWFENQPQTNGQHEIVYRRGLMSFCLQKFVPGMFVDCLFCDWFDEQDALQNRVAQEFASVLLTIKSHLDASEHSSFYQQAIGASLMSATKLSQLPPQILESLAAATSDSDIQNWLSEMLAQLKRRDPRYDVIS